MRSADAYLMLNLAELTWPVTWLFRVSAPWGWTQQVLTVDVPALAGNHNASRDLGAELWTRGLAVASTDAVELLEWETYLWRGGLGSIPMIRGGLTGAQHGPGTAREDSGQFVFHTGHGDQWARRRFPLPSIPVGWVEDRQLSNAGWSALLTIAEGLIAGLHYLMGGGPYRQLIAYPNFLEPTLDNPNGVTFREVKFVRVCMFTDRAPDPSIGL